MSENLNRGRNKQPENPSSDPATWLGTDTSLGPLAQPGMPKGDEDGLKTSLNPQQTQFDGRPETLDKLNTQAGRPLQTSGFSNKIDNSLGLSPSSVGASKTNNDQETLKKNNSNFLNNMSWTSNLWGGSQRPNTKGSQAPESGLGYNSLGSSNSRDNLKSINQNSSLKGGIKTGASSTLGRTKLKNQESGQRPLSNSRRSVGPQVTYEEIGLFPRSFSRVFDRFFKQIFSDVENLVIQEYRFYRYLFLTTIKTLCILFFVPFAVNFIAKTYLIRPITEYFWNTQQTEIFLNSYEQKRAFGELEEFEEKLYFESLLASKNAIVSSPFLKASSYGWGSAPQLTRYSRGGAPYVPAELDTQNGYREDESPQQQVGGVNSSSWGPSVAGAQRSWIPSGENRARSAPTSRTELDKQEPYGLNLGPEALKLDYLNKGVNAPAMLGSQSITNTNVLINSNLADSKGVGNTADKSGKANLATTPAFSQEWAKTNGIKLDNQFAPAPQRSNPSHWTTEVQQAPTLPETLGSLQDKILELAIRYNNHSIEAITNFFADFLSLMTLLYLLVSLEIQINITKSFLLEVFFGLDDSKKSLLILIMTDLLVGYHSSNLWELFFQFIFNHYGIPESQTGIFLLVATLPVLLDVLFKYLIFRHLNRSSPATVATYHAIIE